MTFQGTRERSSVLPLASNKIRCLSSHQIQIWEHVFQDNSRYTSESRREGGGGEGTWYTRRRRGAARRKIQAEAVKGVSPLSPDDFTHVTLLYSSCKSFKETSERPLTPGGGRRDRRTVCRLTRAPSLSLNKHNYTTWPIFQFSFSKYRFKRHVVIDNVNCR